MQNIYIEESDNTPEVKFDFEKGKFEIKGVSYPEYAREFYQPILEAFNEYLLDPPTQHTEMAFKFTYFNTGTNPQINELISNLEKLSQKPGHSVSIKWYYEEDDEDIEELGDYFRLLTSLPIEFVQVEEI